MTEAFSAELDREAKAYAELSYKFDSPVANDFAAFQDGALWAVRESELVKAMAEALEWCQARLHRFEGHLENDSYPIIEAKKALAAYRAATADTAKGEG